MLAKMLTKTKTNMETTYYILAKKRVESNLARMLQNGLGVNIQLPNKSENYEDDD